MPTIYSFQSRAVDGLQVCNSNTKSKKIWPNLPTTYTQNQLPVDTNEVGTPMKLEIWKYLEPILGEKDDIEVDLLTGANCVKALEPIKVISSEVHDPYAYKTVLGLCVVGPMSVNKANLKEVKCNNIYVHEANPVKRANHHFALKGPVREVDIATMLQRMYETNFTEPQLQPSTSCSRFKEFSFNDASFMELMDREVKQIDGHYQLPLPLKNSKLELPNNQVMVERRINQLERRFSKDDSYFQYYKTFMDDMLAKGYAKKSISPAPLGKTWYIPHHGVFNPNKPFKIRVVFHCSAEVGGESINRNLMTGPDLTKQLIGVLIQFQEEHVAIMAGIEAMFYHMKVA